MEAATELSSITIYKNFIVICGLSHACCKDIIHSCCFHSWGNWVFLSRSFTSVCMYCYHLILISPQCKNIAQPYLKREAWTSCFLSINEYVFETFLNQIGQNRKDEIRVSTFPLCSLWKQSHVSEFVIFPVSKWPNRTIPLMSVRRNWFYHVHIYVCMNSCL